MTFVICGSTGESFRPQRWHRHRLWAGFARLGIQCAGRGDPSCSEFTANPTTQCICSPVSRSSLRKTEILLISAGGLQESGLQRFDNR